MESQSPRDPPPPPPMPQGGRRCLKLCRSMDCMTPAGSRARCSKRFDATTRGWRLDSTINKKKAKVLIHFCLCDPCFLKEWNGSAPGYRAVLSGHR
jgi:hypothetical protein